MHGDWRLGSLQATSGVRRRDDIATAERVERLVDDAVRAMRRTTVPRWLLGPCWTEPHSRSVSHQ